MPAHPQTHPWSPERAWHWYQNLAWLVGCNYIPRDAANQLEMWQKPTWNPQTINQELQWAQQLGFNSLRVFLHDLLWQHDRQGLLDRLNQFLDIAQRCHLGIMPVLFDSVWHPFPHLGPQPEPEPGVHNSRWLQSPGITALRDPTQFDSRQSYVQELIQHFQNDPRIHAWDLWNEPDNPNTGSYGPRDLGSEKSKIVTPLLQKTFAWARSASPTQPLTSGVYAPGWEHDHSLSPLARLQLTQSDVITFHCYDPLAQLTEKLNALTRFKRPILCTEYMARPQQNTFAAILPHFKQHGIGAYCWGFVDGRSQTKYPWATWQQPAHTEPNPWFHDVLRSDGSPYDPAETALIRQLCRDAPCGPNAA